DRGRSAQRRRTRLDRDSVVPAIASSWTGTTSAQPEATRTANLRAIDRRPCRQTHAGRPIAINRIGGTSKMFRMIKWAALGVTGLGAAGYFLFGENAMNYVSTMATTVKDSVRGQIPIEFELKRAEGLIGDIGPQVQQCKLEVARQEVQLEGLTDDI